MLFEHIAVMLLNTVQYSRCQLETDCELAMPFSSSLPSLCC